MKSNFYPPPILYKSLYTTLLSRAFLVTIAFLCSFNVAYSEKKERPFIIKGRVVESIAHTPLVGVKVMLLDSTFNVIDSTLSAKEAYVTYFSGNGKEQPAEFSLKMPRKTGVYYLSLEFDKYNPLTRPLEIKRIGSRESMLDLDEIVLTRAPKKLGEVVVTATKVKFYNKGDTLVFNADAFELAEGSMLDALVSQLPGVELKENGQIYVNGRFVENLLLNGKDFFQRRQLHHA